MWQFTDATTTCAATLHNHIAPCDTHTCRVVHTKVHIHSMVLPSHWTSVHNNMQKTLQVLCGIRIGVAAKLLKERKSRWGRRESEADHIPRYALPAEHCGGLPYRSLWARDSYAHMGIRHAGRNTLCFVAGWGISADSSRKGTPPNGGFSLSVFSLSISLSPSLSLIQQKEEAGTERGWRFWRLLDTITAPDLIRTYCKTAAGRTYKAWRYLF